MTGRADRAMKRFELTRIKLYNLAARLLGTRIERVSFVNSKRLYFISSFEVDPFDPRRETYYSHLCVPLLSFGNFFNCCVLIFCTEMFQLEIGIRCFAQFLARFNLYIDREGDYENYGCNILLIIIKLLCYKVLYSRVIFFELNGNNVYIGSHMFLISIY